MKQVAAQAQRHVRQREKGYVLLTMLLIVALMGIFALAAYTTVEFEIRRDQETEMIHRGVQYTRAIRAYYKKFQRYPTKLEDLDSTNNLRYLRKHYKDPLNKNQDFRLLHFGEPGVTLAGGLIGAGLGGGSIPGANSIGSPGGLNGSGPGTSAFGGPGLGGGSGFGNSGVNSSGVFAQSSGPGANSNAGQGTTAGSGSDPTQASGQGDAGTPQQSSSTSIQLVASGPIVGVASFSKKNTIREFNKKKRYNEWQFLYDPTADRGGLITTPYQPALQNFANPGQNNLQTGGATGISSPGSQSSFGQSSFGSGQSGFGNNSSPGGSPAPPPTSTPQ